VARLGVCVERGAGCAGAATAGSLSASMATITDPNQAK
jgi:hypothetical protein